MFIFINVRLSENTMKKAKSIVLTIKERHCGGSSG